MITIKTEVDTSGAKKDLKELEAAASKAAAAATEGVKAETKAVDDLKDSVDAVGSASESAGKKSQDASASAQVAALRAGEAAKNIAEGLANFADVYSRTKDFGQAIDSMSEKLTQAMSIIHPLGGVITAAGIAAVKLYQNFSTTAVEAEKAATAAAKVKKENEEAAKAIAAGAAEAAKMAASFVGWADAGAGVEAVQKQLDGIATTRRIINEQIGKAAPLVAEELLEQKGLLKVEELKLQAQLAILKARHEELAAQETWQQQQAKALKAANDIIKATREENEQTHIEKMEQLHEEAQQALDDAEGLQNRAEEKAELDRKFAEELQKLNEETAEKLRKNFKDFLVDNKERQKLIEKLKEGESKLAEFRAKMHRDDLQRVRDKAALEKAEVERRNQAEIERAKGQIAAEEAVENARQERAKARMEGSAPVQATAGGLQQGANDDRKVFEEFVKQRIADAKKQAESEGKNWREVQKAQAEARKQAAKDWKDFQQGRGMFDPANTNGGFFGITADQANKNMQEEIARARGNIITKNREQADKDAARQKGVTPKERKVQQDGLDIAERQAREQAEQGNEIAQIQERIKALEKQQAAIEAAGAERRRRNGGRP